MLHHEQFGGVDQLSPPTVLHLAQPVDGGVASVVIDLVRAQRADGLTVHLACPPHGHLPTAAARAGALVHRWPAARGPGPGLVGETRLAAALIRRLRPDILHLHSAKAGLAGRLAARGRVPTVFQPHAWSFDAVDGPTRAFALRWERYATRWTSRLLWVSDDERERGRHAGVRARGRVIPNGVDLARFSAPRPGARAAARAELTALPARTPVVVCVGRLCRQKGQDVLLRAWPSVTAELPGAHLVLVGDGPDREALSAASPPSVRCVGGSDVVRDWYAAADLLVLPSRWEGMALAPLEAMACGLPAVLSQVSGARASLPPAHRDRHLVPVGDAEALATALLHVLGDDESRLRAGREAQEYVRTTHDLRGTTAAVRDLYGELCGLPHPDPRERLVP